MVLLAVQYFYIYFVYMTFTCAFVGVCTLFVAFTLDLQQCCQQLEEAIQRFVDMNLPRTRWAKVEVQAQLFEIIDFHGETIQWVELNTFTLAPLTWRALMAKCGFKHLKFNRRLARQWIRFYSKPLMSFFYCGALLWGLILYNIHIVSISTISSRIHDFIHKIFTQRTFKLFHSFNLSKHTSSWLSHSFSRPAIFWYWSEH